MGTQTLNLNSDGVKSWLNKNDISIGSQFKEGLNVNKRLPPEMQPKSNESNLTDTKQTMVQPLYSCSGSRTGSEASLVTLTERTDVTEYIHFQQNYKKLPGQPNISKLNKYRKSLSADPSSTKIQSLQLMTPRSPSNASSRASTKRAPIICGKSLISQSRQRRHRYNKRTIIKEQNDAISISLQTPSKSQKSKQSDFDDINIKQKKPKKTKKTATKKNKFKPKNARKQNKKQSKKKLNKEKAEQFDASNFC